MEGEIYTKAREKSGVSKGSGKSLWCKGLGELRHIRSGDSVKAFVDLGLQLMRHVSLMEVVGIYRYIVVSVSCGRQTVC